MRIIDLVPDVGSEFIDNMARGHQLTQILLTALAYDVFSLTTRMVTAEQVGHAIGVETELTRKFLNVLTALGLLQKKEGEYSNTRQAELFLTKTSPFYQGDLIGLVAEGRPGCSPIDLRQVRVERGDRVPFESAFDRRFILSMAQAALRGTLQKTVREISLLPEFRQAKTLLDLGGGHGLYGVAFSQLNPELKVTIFDLPGVIEVANENIRKWNREAQVSTVAGDFNRDNLGSDYDIVFASDVFYREKEAVQHVLDKVRSSLKPGGLVILKHWFLDQDGTGPLETVLFDFRLAVRGNIRHHIYTKDEFVSLLEETGFSFAFDMDVSISSKPSIIVAGRKT